MSEEKTYGPKAGSVYSVEYGDSEISDGIFAAIPQSETNLPRSGIRRTHISDSGGADNPHDSRGRGSGRKSRAEK